METKSLFTSCAKPIYKHAIFTLMFFLSITDTYSTSTARELFSHQWQNERPLVIFHYKAGDTKTIGFEQLVFLSSEDCQSGYIAHYQKIPSSKGFSIKPKEDFALLSQTTYLTAKSILTSEEISRIRSVIIRFHGIHQELPRFLTACSDEGINCCISIECSNSAGICLPKYEFPRQSFILFAKYD